MVQSRMLQNLDQKPYMNTSWRGRLYNPPLPGKKIHPTQLKITIVQSPILAKLVPKSQRRVYKNNVSQNINSASTLK